MTTCIGNLIDLIIISIKVILIGKSWKTHPEFFPQFQFSGSGARPYYWKTHPCFRNLNLGVIFQLNALFWIIFPENDLFRAPKLLN